MDQAASQGSQAVERDGQRDPEAIREDIERTRRDVGETAAALAEKADVKAQAKAKVGEVKGRVSGATPDSAGQAASTVAAKARSNRTPLIVAGVGAGAFLVGRASARR